MSKDKYYGSMTRAESDRLHGQIVVGGALVGAFIGAVLWEKHMAGFSVGLVSGGMFAGLANNTCEFLVGRFRRAAVHKVEVEQVDSAPAAQPDA